MSNRISPFYYLCSVPASSLSCMQVTSEGPNRQTGGRETSRRTALPPEKAETTNRMLIMTEKKEGMGFQEFKK